MSRSTISRTPADRTRPHHRGALFMEGIPESTKSAFKAACATKGVTMRDAIITLMRDFVRRVSEGKR